MRQRRGLGFNPNPSRWTFRYWSNVGWGLRDAAFDQDCQYDKMNVTKHRNVLIALENRSLRHGNKRPGVIIDPDEALYQEAVDVTDTVSTAGFSDNEGMEMDSASLKNTRAHLSTIITLKEQQEVQGVSDNLLQVHGVSTGKKDEGITRVVYENGNGCSTKIQSNEKLEKAKEIIDELEAEIVAYSEHRINCKHRSNKNGMSQMFQGGEAEIRSVVAHNVHENVGAFKKEAQLCFCMDH